MAAAENETLVRRLFAAFESRDAFALRGLFAGSVAWTLPGRSVLAGVHRGRREVFRFLARLEAETDGTYASRLIDALASETRAAALYRASGTRRGRTLELDQVLLFGIADGAVAEAIALPSDPAAFDEFWA